MKVAVVGLGSMGKRRVRDLLRLGHEVVGLDTRPDRREEASRRFDMVAVENERSLLAAAPRACVIATPPDAHQHYYDWCFQERLPFFSEANILTPRARWFAEREQAAGIRSFPSGTWRFHPLFRALKEELARAGEAPAVNTVHHHYGGYLPLWHPWESYTEFYAGRRKTSAAREMVPFESEFLTWVFGPVRGVAATHARAAAWESDFDDTYMLLLEFENGMRGSLLVELHQASPFRVARISGSGHALALDLTAQELRIYDLKHDAWRKLRPPVPRLRGDFNLEDVYFDEIAGFMDALAGTPYPKSWADDRHLSNILYAAELSASRRQWVTIEEAETLYDGLDWWREQPA
jgi:predicted dehydrogenase